MSVFSRIRGVFGGRKERAFAAASFNPQTMRDWIMSPLSADAELSGSLTTLRARSRQLERDNAHIEAFLNDVEVNVIGPRGFRLQMQAADRIGGKTVFDARANECIEFHWAEFCKAENYLVTGDTDAAAADRLFIRAIARDGGQLIRFVRNFEHGAYGFALQPIEVDCIDSGFAGIAANGNEVRQGVEKDGWGRVTAIYVLTRHPGDMGLAARQPSEWRERIPAKDVLYARLVKRVGQTHGYPMTTPVMLRVRMLDGYMESELVAARAASAKMGFLERTEQSTRMAMPTVSLDAEGKPMQQKPDAGMYMSGQPGTVEQLPVGMSFKAWDPQHPVAQFGDFLKSLLRSVASGLHVSYNKLANDLQGVNYSSLREGKLNERDNWMVLQSWYASHVLTRIFSEWLSYSLLAGNITDLDTGMPLPATKFAKFNRPQFKGRRWGWVDPLKEQQANELARDNGWKSDSEIVEEQGGELEDVYQRIAADDALAKAKGINPKRVAAAPAAPVAEDEDDAVDGEEKTDKVDDAK